MISVACCQISTDNVEVHSLQVIKLQSTREKEQHFSASTDCHSKRENESSMLSQAAYHLIPTDF